MSTTFAIFFGMPGWAELAIIACVMLLLFGHRLPKVMRSLGQGIVEFKKGVNDINDDVEDAAHSVKDKLKDDRDE